MHRKSIDNYFVGFLFGLSCFIFSACFIPEPGCLDIEATNFTLNADEPCGSDDDTEEGCPCSYPNLNLAIDYNFQPFDEVSDTFFLNDSLAQLFDYSPNAIYEIQNQFIRLKSIQFYLSNFQFHQLNGDWIGIEDTMTFVINERDPKDSLFIDNFHLLNQQDRITIGAVRQSGQFDSLRFNVGIDEFANGIIPDSITNTSHPLADLEMHTGDVTNGGYIFNEIVLQKDTIAETVETILKISGNSSLVKIVLPFSYETPIGEDFSIGTLRINHAKWFDGIKFVTDSDAVLIETIIKNTPNVFSITN